MHTSLDCVPCLVRQALDAARATSGDPAVHEAVVRETLALAAGMDLGLPPPALGRVVHRRIRARLGSPDPYRAAKERFTRLALEALPALSEAVAQAPDPFLAALQVSVAANTMDLGVTSTLGASEVLEALRTAGRQTLHGDVERLRQAVARGGDILFLADNAGELVIDRILLDRLRPGRVTVAVRGGPIINDATRDDAVASGLSGLVEVIDNGSDAPGTLLEDCSVAFRERFHAADVVIAKGQGNYETLSDAGRAVSCLFKVKCALVARHTGLPVGAHVLWRAPGPAGAHP